MNLAIMMAHYKNSTMAKFEKLKDVLWKKKGLWLSLLIETNKQMLLKLQNLKWSSSH